MFSGRGLSLKIRIDLLIGLLLFCGLAADLARVIVDARPRVQAEDEAMTRISKDFAQAALASLQDSPDPEAGLRQMLASLGRLRHVRISFVKSNEAAALAFVDSSRHVAPRWFAALIGASPSVSVLPAVAGGRTLGQIVIASNPSDEIDEIWEAASSLGLIGGAVAMAALLGASLLLGRTLRPLGDYGATLGRLRDGDFVARALPAGSPEFVDIGLKINSLAEALEGFKATNQSLIQQLLEVQDDERKAIAHELHDEIGSHLFAIRASAVVLAAGLRAEGADRQALRASAIGDQVEALQGHNRRILRRLRPAALDDLGLAEALEILVKGWRETEPSVDLTLDLPDKLDDCHPLASLALYRLVQEALTNVYRHARASHASVSIACDMSQRNLRVKVRDDGVGLKTDARPGLGLTGMRERMRALGGSFACGPSPEGGTLVEAMFPLRD
jgi:two-component system, NarL family, sensor histidine kinase UhpB